MLDWVGERPRGCDDAARQAQFVDLHRDHATGVFNLALQLVGHREDARDITQEVLLKAFEQLARPGPFNARAWLYRVTVNACFDHLRARRRKPVIDLEGRAEPAATVNEYEQAELQRQLGCALRRLPPAQRTALMLREVHGLPVAEVAYVLGVQTDSAAVTLSRARSSFRRRFLEVANGATTELREERDADVGAAGDARRRRALGGGASAGLVVGVGIGLPSLWWPALPLPASLEASSLLPALAPAAPVAALAAPAAAAGAAGAIGKIAAALSTKAAAVAVGASLVAGGVGGVYTAERTATSTRHAGAVTQASAHAVDKARGVGNAASPHPSPRSTAPGYALASPSPGASSSVLPTVSAAPQPAPSETTLGETGDPVVDGGGSGIIGSPSPTPSPVATPSASASAPAPDPTPSPSASPSASVSPSPSP